MNSNYQLIFYKLKNNQHITVLPGRFIEKIIDFTTTWNYKTGIFKKCVNVSSNQGIKI